MVDQEPLDVKGAARRLGLDDRTVERMARAQRIPAFKVGRRWRFRPDVIEDIREGRLAIKPALKEEGRK